MDKKRSLLNVIVSISFKIVLLIGTLLVKRFLIKYIGNDVNGLNSLFLSIIGVLSVAELGVGSAISFSMYKPIVEQDTNKVSALYFLYKKLYIIIGSIIFICGLLVLPFLKYLISDYEILKVNVYSSFLLMLLSVVITYAFNAKISLINAYKNNYITTIINSSCEIIRYILQIIVIICFQSFYLYLICRIAASCLEWILISIITNKRHRAVLAEKHSIDANTKQEITKNIKAMFMHKIGGVLVNTIDNVVISTFIGVVVLGSFSNYTTIAVSLNGILSLFFTPLVSVIGHYYVKSKDSIISYYRFFHTINFVIGSVFFLGYFAIIDELISILYGSDLIISKLISLVITFNQFTSFLRNSALLFRDSTGTFYYDRWKPILEGCINLVLSITFVLLLPNQYKVIGVIGSTILTTMFICHIIEPFVLYKHVFKKSPVRYYIKNYFFHLLFLAELIVMNFIKIDVTNIYLKLFINGTISVCISLFVVILILICDKNSRTNIGRFIRRKKQQDLSN